MSDVKRRISLSISPATETTCGDGSGKFCPLVHVGLFGAIWSCAAFGPLLENEAGWLARRDECRDAEEGQ